MNFYKRLETLSEQNNKNVSNVLVELGLSTSKQTAWKNGSVPKGDILVMLANYFDVSVDYLMGQTDIQSSLTEDTLSDDEKKIIELLRTSTPELRNAVEVLLKQKSVQS